MLTVDVPLTEQERDLIVEELRNYLQSIDESGNEEWGGLDQAPLECFEEEERGRVEIIQGIINKLKEAF